MIAFRHCKMWYRRTIVKPIKASSSYMSFRLALQSSHGYLWTRDFNQHTTLPSEFPLWISWLTIGFIEPNPNFLLLKHLSSDQSGRTCIDLSSAYIAMGEHLAYRIDVGASCNLQCCKSMTETMHNLSKSNGKWRWEKWTASGWEWAIFHNSANWLQSKAEQDIELFQLPNR